ncbi:MAG: LTA synthase family protein [Oscillospiraceae bacterium]
MSNKVKNKKARPSEPEKAASETKMQITEESVSKGLETKAADEVKTEVSKKKNGKKNKDKSAAKQSKFKEYICNNALFITFVVSMVINSLILRAFTVKFGESKEIFDVLKAVVKPMLADIFAVSIIGVFAFIARKQKGRFIYLMIWTVVFSILAAGNSIYYTNYKSFLSVSLASTASQLGGVMDAVTKNIMEPKDFILIWPIFAMIAVYVILKKTHEKGYVKQKLEKTKLGKYAGTSLIVAFCSAGLFCTMLTKTDCSRLVKQWNRESVMSSFGMYVYQISDAVSSVHAKINMMFGYEKNKQHFDEFFDSTSDDSKNTVVNEELKEKDNDYSDIFKGKNVIAIHAESIQNFTLDTAFNGVELTPNLNKLRREGLFFSNFYSQESVGTSSDSEFTYSSSLMPASSGTVAINYWNRDYATTQKKFGDMGYYVFSMHGNNGSYWNRLNLHASLGYDRLYHSSNDFIIDETIGLGLSDMSFFRQAVPKIKEISEQNDNYYGTLIMLTNHTPFTDIDRVSDYEVNFKFKQYNDETGMYEEIVRPFLEGTKLGSYFKSVHYADEAIGQLMSDLDSEGLLDNTVIVIYGDHDAKVKEEEYEYYYNYNPFSDTVLTEDDEGYIPIDEFYYNLNRKVPLIIWSKDGGYEPKEISKVMGMYDVQPTLGNMFGFTNKYALGHDIFSIGEDEENVVIFPNGNFLTDSVYFDNQKDTYFDLSGYINPASVVSCNQVYKNDPIPLYSDEREGLFKFSESEYSAANAEARKNDGAVDEQYISDRCEYAEERIDISNAIIYYDMINKSDHGFDEEIPDNNSRSEADEFFAPPDRTERKPIFAI